MFNDDTYPSKTCSHAFQDVQGHVWAGKGESLTRSPDPVSLLGHRPFSQEPPVVSAQPQWSAQRSGAKGDAVPSGEQWQAGQRPWDGELTPCKHTDKHILT